MSRQIDNKFLKEDKRITYELEVFLTTIRGSVRLHASSLS